MTLLAWCVAWILDVVIGDPPHWPHPVRWIGRLIAVSQRVVRRVCHSDRALRIGGGVMWLVVIGLTWGVAWAYWRWRTGSTRLGWLVEVWMIFTALAGRCLAQSAMAVARPLQAGDLAESRHKLSDCRARYLSAPASADQPCGGGDRGGEHGGWHYRAALFPAPRRRAAGHGL
nr:cobalamin biosynthesis protein [Klebsiella pneumoniae subsp. pneumoniae]